MVDVVKMVAAARRATKAMEREASSAREFVELARCPQSMAEATNGVWVLHRTKVIGLLAIFRAAPYSDYMLLGKYTEATLHQPYGDIVMEDSPAELLTHYQFFRSARGSVLISGLGLGCIVRALAAKPQVTDITVLEIDPWIIEKVGAEFAGNPKVTVLHQDARSFEPGRKFDYAWHDIYTEEGNGGPLALLHTEIMVRLRKHVRRQGAWNYPKEVARVGNFFWGAGRTMTPLQSFMKKGLK